MAIQPLGKGYLTGTIKTTEDVAGKNDGDLPRFNDNTLTQHQELVDKVKEDRYPPRLHTRDRSPSPGSSQPGPYTCPIPGTSRTDRATENSKAAGRAPRRQRHPGTERDIRKVPGRPDPLPRTHAEDGQPLTEPETPYAHESRCSTAAKYSNGDCRLNGGTGWSEIRKESDHD